MTLIVDAADLLAGATLQLFFGGCADRADIRNILFRPACLTDGGIQHRRILRATEIAFGCIGLRPAQTTQLFEITRIVIQRIESESAELLALRIHGATGAPWLALAGRVGRRTLRTTLEAGLPLVRGTGQRW